MAILDDIHSAIQDAFNTADSPFQPATITRVTQTGGGAFTQGVETIQKQSCLAFIDTYSEEARAQLGIPDTDVKIMVLQHSASGVQVDLRNGDTITMRGDWRVIRRDQDPAQATWTAQARPV